MALAQDLLEQADHLAHREPRRPKQASLRRAISTAYYALFHLLISETTRNWRRPQERQTLARMFEHNHMSKACVRKRDAINQEFNTGSLASTELISLRQLREVAQTFITLQHQRHEADYGSKHWTRSDVEDKIVEVTNAFADWQAIRSEAVAQDFLVTLLLKER